ncbi:MAG: response regulator [Pseudomonadota bacterium]
MTARIVLVEDELHIIEALSFILSREGFDVDTFTTGVGLVEKLQDAPPNLVVLDYMLPDISGLQILNEIRATEALKTLPVLMLTAKGQAKDREAAETAGVSRFMTKPFSNAEIIDVTKEMCRND